jgi:hypothetical protein
MIQQLQHACRDVDPRQRISGTGLEQDHLRTGFREPRCDNATGRAGSYNHIVRFHLRISGSEHSFTGDLPSAQRFSDGSEMSPVLLDPDYRTETAVRNQRYEQSKVGRE